MIIAARRTALWAGALLVPLLAFTQGGEVRHRLATDAALRAAPGSSQVLGTLVAGAPVVVVSQQGEWAQIRAEGWVPLFALGGPSEPEPAPFPEPSIPGSPAPVPHVPVPPPPPAAARPIAGVTVQGLVSLPSRRRLSPGAGATIYLLAQGSASAWESNTVDEADRLRILDEEMARIDKEISTVMHGASFDQSMQMADALKRQRETKMDQRAQLLAATHARHEAEARSTALASTSADASGQYVLLGVAPGSYTLFARLHRDDVEVEWVMPLQVQSADVRVDLDPSNARGLPPDQP